MIKDTAAGVSCRRATSAMVIHGDFETRSVLDLKKVGIHRYVAHPLTDAWCFAWALDDEAPSIWTMGEPFPLPLATALAHGATFTAHNCNFELAVWNKIMRPRYGWPVLHVDQCRCTMAQAYAMALPGSLENCAAALGLTEQKDIKGHRLMMQMSAPRAMLPEGAPVWWDDFDRLQTLYEYCMQDVRVEQQMSKRLLNLRPDEQKLWMLDHRINQRGIYVDVPNVRRALAIVALEMKRLNATLYEITNGMVSSASEIARFVKWLREHGVNIPSLAKADVIEALLWEDIGDAERRALEIRQLAGKTSTAKLDAMLTIAGDDYRVRDCLQYHAAGTGRWGGRKVQPQNMPRPRSTTAQQTVEFVIDDIIKTCDAANAAEAIDTLYGSPLAMVTDCLRGMICAAPGNELMASDYASIESRVLAWLAEERWKLKAYADYDAGKGPGIYELGYAKSFGIAVEDVTKDQRFIGKVQELACGYEGGKGAFKTMARAYNVDISDDQAETFKTAWRSANPNIVSYWHELNQAALDAVRHPGLVFAVVRAYATIRFVVKGSFLWCQLPSGRALCYPYPKLAPNTTPWGEVREQLSYMSVDAITKKWGETFTYGGKLAENVTQAVSRDILANALPLVEAAGYPVIMHVHDEIVSEVRIADKKSLAEFNALVATTPGWAAYLPIAVEGWRGKRYRK